MPVKEAGREQDARERLLAGALELFNRKGYAATTVREIVEAAGVTKPVLYYYFRSKEGIYLEIMRVPNVKFGAFLETAAQTRGPVAERIRVLCCRLFELFREHIQEARLMYAIYYGPPQGAPHFDFEEYHTKVQDLFRGLVREGIRSRELRKADVEDVMWAVIGAMNIAMELELCHPERGIGSRGLSRVLDTIFRGIVNDGETEKRERR